MKANLTKTLIVYAFAQLYASPFASVFANDMPVPELTPLSRNAEINNRSAMVTTKTHAIAMTSGLLQSADGVKWNPVRTAVRYAPGFIKKIASNGTLFVALQYSDGRLLWSGDGRDWSELHFFVDGKKIVRTDVEKIYPTLEDIAGGNGFFVMTGSEMSCVISTDAINWADISCPLPAGKIFAGDGYLVNYSDADFHVFNMDTQKWSAMPSPAGEFQQDCSVFNGRCAFLRSGEVHILHPDGWTSTPYSSPNNISNIVAKDGIVAGFYNKGVYIADENLEFSCAICSSDMPVEMIDIWNGALYAFLEDGRVATWRDGTVSIVAGNGLGGMLHHRSLIPGNTGVLVHASDNFHDQRAVVVKDGASAATIDVPVSAALPGKQLAHANALGRTIVLSEYDLWETTDFSDWKLIEQSTRFSKVAGNESVLLLLGGEKAFWTTDLANMTEVDLGITDPVADVIWDGTRFLALTSTGALYEAAPFGTFVKIHDLPEYSFYSQLVYHNGFYHVAAGQLGVMLSEDGRSWSNYKFSHSSAPPSVHAIAPYEDGLLATIADGRIFLIDGMNGAAEYIPNQESILVRLARGFDGKTYGVSSSGSAFVLRPTHGKIAEIEPATSALTMALGEERSLEFPTVGLNGNPIQLVVVESLEYGHLVSQVPGGVKGNRIVIRAPAELAEIDSMEDPLGDPSRDRLVLAFLDGQYLTNKFTLNLVYTEESPASPVGSSGGGGTIGAVFMAISVMLLVVRRRRLLP